MRILEGAQVIFSFGKGYSHSNILIPVALLLKSDFR